MGIISLLDYIITFKLQFYSYIYIGTDIRIKSTYANYDILTFSRDKFVRRRLLNNF